MEIGQVYEAAGRAIIYLTELRLTMQDGATVTGQLTSESFSGRMVSVDKALVSIRFAIRQAVQSRTVQSTYPQARNGASDGIVRIRTKSR